MRKKTYMYDSGVTKKLPFHIVNYIFSFEKYKVLQIFTSVYENKLISFYILVHILFITFVKSSKYMYGGYSFLIKKTIILNMKENTEMLKIIFLSFVYADHRE